MIKAPQKRRILLISSNSSSRGGGERYLVFLTKGLRSIGHEVFALLSDVAYMDCWEKDLADVGAIVYRRPLIGLRDRPLRIIQSMRDRDQIAKISSVCREIRPDGILVNQQYDEDGLDYLEGALSARIAPVIGVMHLPMTKEKNKRFLGRIRGWLLSRWYKEHPYLHVFVSQGAQAEYESYYSHPRPTAVINNGIPFSSLSGNSTGIRIWDDGIPVIGFTGQFVPQKNLLFLVEGWLASLSSGVSSHLLLVGDGPLRKKIEHMLWQSAPPGAWYITGWVNNPEDYLEGIDLFALVSHYEGLSLSLLEAAGRGIPALVTPFNGASDIANYAPWVRVVSNQDVGDFSTVLSDTLRELPSLRAVANNGLEDFRRRFSVESMAVQTLSMFEKGKGNLLNVVVFFINIGPYHLSRLKAAHESCHARGWVLTAVQATDNALQHPWGNAEEKLPFRLVTLQASNNIRHDPKWGPLINDREVIRCLDGLSPDVVFLPGWSIPIARAGISWCRRHGVPTVLMSESKWDDEPRRWWKEKVKAWFYVRKFNAALVGGKQHQEYAVALGLPADKIFFGYDAVDNDYFINAADAARRDPDRVRQQRPSLPSRNFFLCVTRFLPRKNVPHLVEAYASYRGAVGPELAWDLVLCGSGIEEKRIFEIIRSAELEQNVHMPGFLPYGEIADWYGMAGAFIHPALKEQWGLVINEACSAGLPILSSRTVGAAYELVRDGVNGYLFDPEDIGDMAKSMVRLHRLDEESRYRMGAESRKIVSDYSPRRFADGFSKAVIVARSQPQLRTTSRNTPVT